MGFARYDWGQIMLVEQGPVISEELIQKWQESERVLIPLPMIEFWKVHGNGGMPDPECNVLINWKGMGEEESNINSILGLFHPIRGVALENYLSAIPCHLPLFPFASDDGGGMYGVSICPNSYGFVYFFYKDERKIVEVKDLFFVASSPLEMFEIFSS